MTPELSEVLEAPAIEVEASKRPGRKATRPANQEPPAPSQPTVAGPTKRVRKPTSEVAEPAARKGRKTPTPEEEPAPAVKRTVRKAAVKNEKETKTTLDPLTRRGRPPKATNTGGTSKPEKSGIGKPSTSGVRGGTKTIPVEHNKDDGSDPLDTFNTPDQATVEDPLPTVAPTKADTKARKPRTAMKHEEETAEVLKATRGRPPAATTRSTATKTPAPTRGRPRKTPATAPAAIQVVDKENTPGTTQTAAGSSTTDEGVVVKVRTTRKTRTTTVKEEGEEGTTATQSKPRAIRATRVRTKTT